jgi:hypothetical protein
MWDWDEALFSTALRHYNVASHHPHPPGFPLFIVLAKGMRLLVHDDFQALRTVSLLMSFLIFPAMYALGRSLRFEFRSAVIAALIFSFIPNVWFWGGTAMSDMSSLVLVILAAAILLRDDRRLGIYFLGSALFAASMLVRPQNVLVIYPWLIASWHQLRLRGGRGAAAVAASAALISVIVLGGYGGAALATGWNDYLYATRVHQQYVSSVDGFRNPSRVPSRSLIYSFWVDPSDVGQVSKLLVALALIAFLRPRRRDFEVLAIFGPPAIFTLFMLNPSFVSRFAIAYMPMHALLAADGMEVVGLAIAWRARNRERILAAAQAVIATVIIGRYIYWSWPALREVRMNDSPPAAAMKWIQTHVPRASGQIYVHTTMSPFADYFLSGYQQVPVGDEVDPLLLQPRRGAYYTADRLSHDPNAVNFRRPARRLWSLFVHRYFGASVAPVGGWTRAMEGWYGEENYEGEALRWMGRRSRTLLQPLGKAARLELHLYAPIDAEPPPTVTVTLNEKVIDRFVATTALIDRKYDVQSGSGSAEVLVIEVDRTVNPARTHRGSDTRDLGLQLRSMLWRPLQ